MMEPAAKGVRQGTFRGRLWGTLMQHRWLQWVLRLLATTVVMLWLLTQLDVQELGYPLKAGHRHDFNDIALHGVFVSEAGAGPRCGITPFQRDPERSAGKIATLASCHPQLDNRSYAAPSTPWTCALASLADCDAAARGHRCGPPPLTRRAERFSPGGSPMCAMI